MLIAILTAIITNHSLDTFPGNTMEGSVGLTIRHATVEDAAGIAEIHVRTWQSAYCGLLPEDDLAAMTPEQRLPMWSRMLSNSNSPMRVFVAERNDTLVGFVSIGPAQVATEDADAGELFAMYVDPPWQGTGAGRALMARAEAAMIDAGVELAILWVLEGNERAQRFYYEHGWLPDGAVKEDVLFDVPVREVRFRKRL